MHSRRVRTANIWLAIPSATFSARSRSMPQNSMARMAACRSKSTLLDQASFDSDSAFEDQSENRNRFHTKFDKQKRCASANGDRYNQQNWYQRWIHSVKIPLGKFVKIRVYSISPAQNTMPDYRSWTTTPGRF